MPRGVSIDRRTLLAAESETFHPVGAFRVALVFPNRYAVAMSSLGYQAVWARFDALPDVACERVVMPERSERGTSPLVSLETGRLLGAFDLVAFSISDELDIMGIIEALERGGLNPLAEERSLDAPPVVAGGPLTQSDPRPLGPFVDAVLCGDSEGLLAPLVNAARASRDRSEFSQAVAEIPHAWVPTIQGDDAPSPRMCSIDDLPAWSRVWTPHAELRDMALVEVSRGCPRRCAFCLSQRKLSPERRVPLERVWEHVPENAPRVGFVGSAVSDHPGLKTLVERAVARGQGVGVSSLRADRLDDELVDLLVRGGLRTMTVASDATSQALRDAIHKGIREAHLERAAALARAHGVTALKLYTLVGLPEETEGDIDEWIALCRRLKRKLRVVVAVNPFIPKRGTPLVDAPFAPLRVLSERIHRMERALRREGVAVRSLSPRWAWVQWRLSRDGQSAGWAAWEARRAGGSYADWKRAFKDRPDPD